MAVVRVAREALEFWEGLRDPALRRRDLGEEERDLRVLLRRLLRLRQVECFEIEKTVDEGGVSRALQQKLLHVGPA